LDNLIVQVEAARKPFKEFHQVVQEFVSHFLN
jgi:hypothetical protein